MVRGRKPNLDGEKVAHRMLRMSDVEVEDRKKRLIRWTVIEDTAKSYEAKIRELKRFANVMGMKSCDFKTLELFLVGIQADGFSASVGTTAACAWKFQRKLDGKKKISTTEAEKIQTMLDGWSYRSDEQYKTPRGVLDSAKLKILTRYAINQGQPMYAFGFVLAWQLMLRHGRLPAFTVGNVRMGTDVGDIIWVDRRKNFNAKSMKTQSRGQFKPVRNMTVWLRKWTKGRAETEKLLPYWDQKVACAIIRSCAKEHEWDTTVEWDGPHCERYGANEERTLLTEPAIEIMLHMKRADWKDKRMSTKVYVRK